MKKLLVTLVILAITAGGAKAQMSYYNAGESFPRNEVSVGFGIGSVSDFASIFADIFVNVYTVGLERLHTSGTWALSYDYRITKVIGVGAEFAFAGYYGDVKADRGGGRLSKNFYSIMPQAKLNWLNRRFVTMYSRVAFGVCIVGLDRTFADGTPHESDTIFSPMLQLSPIGIEVGKGIAGYFELGFGATGVLNIGIRGRF